MKQISYDNKPSLYLVPTPIGNLKDITYRAVETLENVDLILAEDTRITKNLLNYFKINKKVICNNKDNEFKNVNFIINKLKEKNNIALVTDRGTPLISDPGNILVKKVIESGYNVICLPGATALIPALAVSGLDTDKFLFFGFLNSKPTKRINELKELIDIKQSIILYEAPHRIEKTLKDIFYIMGNRNISLIREISKLHEEVIRDTIENVIKSIDLIKGEYVIIVEGNKEEKKIDLNPEILYDNYLKQGLTKNEAIKQIAHDLKVKKNDIYQIFNKE